MARIYTELSRGRLTGNTIVRAGRWKWTLLAAHVRTNHVHMVVEGDATPEAMMNGFKAYASRRLNAHTPMEADRKRWVRHGSTRWLWKDQDVRDAIRYVVEGHGEVMAVYVADDTPLPDGRGSE